MESWAKGSLGNGAGQAWAAGCGQLECVGWPVPPEYMQAPHAGTGPAGNLPTLPPALLLQTCPCSLYPPSYGTPYPGDLAVGLPPPLLLKSYTGPEDLVFVAFFCTVGRPVAPGPCLCAELSPKVLGPLGVISVTGWGVGLAWAHAFCWAWSNSLAGLCQPKCLPAPCNWLMESLRVPVPGHPGLH